MNPIRIENERPYRDMGLSFAPGKPYPLGASWDGRGVNFAVYSEYATKVEVCLFADLLSKKEEKRFSLSSRSGPVWHGYFSGLKPGVLYGYRVHGPFEPWEGHWFNPYKVLLDPYAKSIARLPVLDLSLYAYRRENLEKIPKESDISIMSEADNAAFSPLARVIDESFDWSNEHKPSYSWQDTILYEAHIKSMTINHPDIPKDLRGTFLGFCSEPILNHLKSMGITSVELLPIHQSYSGARLQTSGLSDYWGYNTLNFFSPDIRYARKGAEVELLRDFKTMVKTFHSAGIEIILDVVYNHTCEEDHFGPNLHFRGLCNRSYYRLEDHKKMMYRNYSGCGNTLDVSKPVVLDLIINSLRYWASETHVDGFRFDLAASLIRGSDGLPESFPSFIAALKRDPLLSELKLIAEPWDLEGNFQDRFPSPWREWSDTFRDSVRKFWNSGDVDSKEILGHLGQRRLTPETTKDLPFEKLNFITCHDGFTLQDLVSYNGKHNEKNGENNRDGADQNYSWNCGEEGPTHNEDILSMRERQKRNLISNLLLSSSVPMLSGGDELSRTQKGNNNAYCQDNNINFYDWESDAEKEDFFAFVNYLIRYRKSNPIFGKIDTLISDDNSLLWKSIVSDENGVEISDPSFARSGSYPISWYARFRKTDLKNIMRETDSEIGFILLLNPTDREVKFVFPESSIGSPLCKVIDTSEKTFSNRKEILLSSYIAQPKSLVLFEEPGSVLNG
ncbi:glycogen debranching protein GlgX [Leptospira sp. WS58.C1]|uniref:glycogen debranching protein GlgX n=1 Tax=Leptospira cinconiae TaxID=3235173 RepID=UPI00349E4CBC